MKLQKSDLKLQNNKIVSFPFYNIVNKSPLQNIRVDEVIKAKLDYVAFRNYYYSYKISLISHTATIR